MVTEFYPIAEYPNYYISKSGKVLSIKGRPKLLKPSKNDKGYLQIQLFKNGKRKIMYIHRIVAITFIPNPNNYPIINHKDENPLNNNLNNLEWCTQSYNVSYGNSRKSMSVKVNAYKYPAMEFVGTFKSISEAGRKLNIHHCSICNILKGKQISTKGYFFEYAD